jgi:O-antigen/teichoic acid export membrane protein
MAGTPQALDMTEAPEVDLLSTPEAGPAVVRGGVMRTGAFLGGSLFSVAAAALLFRKLGVTDTGRYTTAMSLGAVVVGVTDFGLNIIGLRELSVLRGEQRDSLARTIIGMRLVLTSAGAIVVTAFAFAAYGDLLGLGVLVACIGMIAQSVQTTLTMSLLARLRLGWISALELARQMSAAIVIALLVFAGAHLLAYLAVTAITTLLLLPPTIALVRGDIPIRPSFDMRRWRELIVPGLAYSAATVTATLYLRVAIVLVSLTDSSSQLGYFSVSYRVVESLLALPSLLVGSAFPIFAHAARDDPARLAYALSRVLDASLIVGTWASVTLAVGASLAIDVIAGRGFQPATSVLAVQGLVVGAVFVSSIWASVLLSLHKHRVILIFNLSLLALVTIAVAVMAPLFGAMGAAIATAAVEITAAIAGAFVVIRGRPHLRPNLQTLPKVAAAAVAGASPMLLSGVPVIGRLALSSFLYLAVLLVLRGFPSDLLAMLTGSRPGREG